MLQHKLAVPADRELSPCASDCPACLYLESIDGLQDRMVKWGAAAFGALHINDPKVRGIRMLEEALEFAQAVGVPVEQCQKLVGYVYSRPAGNPSQEMGGVGVTALVAANAIGVRFIDALREEVARVESKPPEEFAKRNQVKLAAGFDGKSLEE